MNQGILFNDQFDIKPQEICFVAQLQGMKIKCIIDFQMLSNLSGETVNATNAATIYEEYRFDIEELAEQAINHECYQDDGSVRI
ncbi:DUF1488 domain-containing protein [Shewanella aestuarii]|uniref:DUF1488 domain-containing protein n=1 Tax=Shewanella aestuarii TaxID=1028752 RepID=A0A6G9QGR8_9GAMM|nr:DUF1488 domain-containing protein [Shewanella aestuarii]QIR13101.1 DUF1488 domain-containing protein [Shewanella aestuarii]